MTAIRALDPRDVPELLPLISALAQHHGETASASTASLSEAMALGWLWGFGAGAPLQGYALAYPVLQAQFGRRGVELHHLFVVPSHRGRGLGKALIAAVEADARDRGCAFVRIGAHAGNAAAGPLYQAAGYVRRDVRFQRFRKAL
jgi:GNAT superfamily N-acetyltransferase